MKELKEYSDRPKKPYLERLLSKANLVINLLNRLDNSSYRSCFDKKNEEIIFQSHGIGMKIEVPGSVDFVVGDLSNDKVNDVNASWASDGTDLSYFLADLSERMISFDINKVGRTGLSSIEILQLLEECLELIYNDLLPKKGNIVRLAQSTGKKCLDIVPNNLLPKKDNVTTITQFTNKKFNSSSET